MSRLSSVPRACDHRSMNQQLSRVRVPFVEHLGIRLAEQTNERAVIVLDKRPELLNSWGAAHGGVIMTMLDYVMSAAVRGHYGLDAGVLTMDMSVGFMKAGFGEKIRAEARVLHGGQSTAFCEGEARDEKGDLLAKAIGTFKLLGDRK
ncbi:MAG: PaaI family thioesterase [Burkholderiales bacterium]